MAFHTLLILADFDLGAIIQILFVLALFVFPMLLRIWNSLSGAGKQAPQREVIAQAGEPSMENQIEDFLRRAAQQGPDATVHPQPEIQYAEPVHAEPVEAEFRDAVVHESVSEHVEHYMEARDIGGRRQQERIGSSIESIEQHVHELFDHPLGSLQRISIEEDKSPDVPKHEEDSIDHFETADARDQIDPTTVAGDVATMLRESHNLRTAIVLNEILKPASARW